MGYRRGQTVPPEEIKRVFVETNEGWYATVCGFIYGDDYVAHEKACERCREITAIVRQSEKLVKPETAITMFLIENESRYRSKQDLAKALVKFLEGK